MNIHANDQRQRRLSTSLRLRGHRSRTPNGVVLLVALGMLALFSVLTVTYIVFSSQARNASVSFVSRVNQGERPKDLTPLIIRQIVVGTTNSRSAAFQHSLLEDLYAYDSVRLRVAHYRTGSSLPPAEVFGRLLRPLPGAYVAGQAPPSTLFRFPLRFARWNYDGTAPSGTALQIPEFAQDYNGPPFNGDNPVTAAVEPNDLNTQEQFDDAYTGRIVTFLEGPLADASFRIVRSFGQDGNAAYVPGDAESILSHNLVIDLSEFDSPTIDLLGESNDRWILANRAPTSLLYGGGPDDRPGVAGVDDNSTGGIDDAAEFGWPGSDDMGYLLVINGQTFNGDGMDANFASGTLTEVRPGWNAYFNGSSPSDWGDSGMTALLQPNSRYVGPLVGGTPADEPQPDESYDAPDLENLFLAWQPSTRTSGVAIHSFAAADQLINQAIVPSFHRPALFNYLMNQPITGRTFAEIAASPMIGDDARIRILNRRLRRACLRPLPFVGNAEDLDGDGEFMDGNPEFTGSNPTPVLSLQLDPSPTVADVLQIRLLARWLVNGPWDVDNDGDGIPDSIWLDFDLPSFTASDGTLLRPLVAPLIEDMDGRVNLNTAGNHAQMASNFFGLNFPSAPPPAVAGTVTPSTYRLTARGFGVGPAEVYPGFLLGRQFHFSPTSVANSLNPAYGNALFGRVLQTRYGGRNANLGAAGFQTGAIANDLVSQMIHPARRDMHAFNAPMGKPLDLFGRGVVDLDLQGNVAVQNLSTAVATAPDRNERTNEPYEWATDGPPLGDDKPFSNDELLSVIDRNNPNRMAFQTRLLDLLEQTLQSNPELDRLITTDSRSQRSPELSGYGGTTNMLGSILDLYVTRLETWMAAGSVPTLAELAAIENVLTRMLAVEFRKGTKLNLNRPLGNGIDDTTPPNGLIDEAAETAAEPAYPFLPSSPGAVNARYVPFDPAVVGDFTDLSGQELLARHLYSLMFLLIRDPAADSSVPDELVPNFTYPQYTDASGMKVPFVNDPAIRNRYVARRLAQWAVNAVDFRDTNCAMTRFRYDEDPFDATGWDTSGGFETVWGFEPSDLVLTEAIATHDRGIRDTNIEVPMDGEKASRTITDPMDTADSDMDQLRMPTASAFVEVTNARPLTTGGSYLHFPAELYDFSTTPPQLDLARVVTDSGTGRVSPVWRVAVGDDNVVAPGDTLKSPRWLTDGERLSNAADDPFNGVDPTSFTETHVHEVEFQTGADGLLHFSDATGSRMDPDRVVWFTNLDPTAGTTELAELTDPGRVYRNVLAANPSAVPRLAPGQFAVIAPRQLTHFGQKTTCAQASSFAYDPSDQKIEILFDGGTSTWEVHYTDLSATDHTPAYPSSGGGYRIRGIVPIVAQAPVPTSPEWTNYFSTVVNANEQVDFGFNISAPHTGTEYYPAPDQMLNSTAGTAFPRVDAYYDAVTLTGEPRDVPVDEENGPSGPRPLKQNNWLSGGTHQDAKTAFLQRLADPTQAWNATTNPYITVDWITLDLHVFSGHQDLDDTVDANGDGNDDEPVDPHSPVGTYIANMEFDSRRKIPDTRRDRVGTVGGTLFMHRSMYMNRLNILNGKTAAVSSTFFDFDMRSDPTLGFNTGLGDDLDTQAFPATLGYISREFGLPRVAGTPNYAGMPERTYMAALPWYDRDYASPYELAMVPACSAARLGVEFDLGWEVDPAVANPPENAASFRHLLGFDAGYDSPNNLNNVLGVGPGFEQIFDFVDTGPIYAGDERWIDPAQTELTGNAVFDRVSETLRPPFNHITKHRVPGKVNLNTTPDHLQVTTPAPDVLPGTGQLLNNVTNFDFGETPAAPEAFNIASNTNAVRYSSTAAQNRYTGNGAVYQSLAWGYSTAFELDTGQFGGTTIPSLSGPGTAYASTQDTPFGYNFKGFIESRTGFSQAVPTGGYSAPLEDLRNRFVFHVFPSRFAGLFGPASTANLPMLQSYLPLDVTGTPVRRTYDISLMRPHPDLRRRAFTTPPAADQFDMAIDAGGGTPIQSQILSTPLFERSHAELHRDNRLYDRNPMFRWRNTAKLANMTTHHSNVFLIRFTIGYFKVDPQTGEVGGEYGIETNNSARQKGVFMVDRTIPVAFERGQTHNAMKTVLLESLEQ